MVKTDVKSLKVVRLSAMPNENKSYAYRILGTDNQAVAELLEQVEGIYDSRDEDGGKILYSRNRLGTQNVPTTAVITVREQVQKGVRTGRFFINLENKDIEAFGDFADKVVLAERFGITQSAAAVAAFFGVREKVGTTAPRVTPTTGGEGTTTTTTGEEGHDKVAETVLEQPVQGEKEK